MLADLGFGNISTIGTGALQTSGSTFATMSQLSDLINQGSGGFTNYVATISSPAINSTLRIYNKDATDTIAFDDNTVGNVLLTDLGLDSATISPVYDPASETIPLKSLASGSVNETFGRSLTVYTSLGEGIELQVGFVKLIDERANNGGQTWGVDLVPLAKLMVYLNFLVLQQLMNYLKMASQLVGYKH